MKLTTKSRYATRALLEIARGSTSRPVTRREITQRQGISSSYLDNILGELRHAGFIQAVRGKGGGYRLNRSPRDITLLEIVEALQGPIAPVECLHNPACCERVSECVTRRAWAQLQRAERDTLKGIDFAQLLEESKAKENHTYTI